MVKKISQKDYEQMNQGGPLLLDFSAVWCQPCQMLAPVLEEVSGEYEGKMSFYSVDVDENPNLAASFGVQGIPALVIIKDGAKADMSVGFQPKENLKAFIDSNL